MSHAAKLFSIPVAESMFPGKYTAMDILEHSIRSTVSFSPLKSIGTFRTSTSLGIVTGMSTEISLVPAHFVAL